MYGRYRGKYWDIKSEVGWGCGCNVEGCSRVWLIMIGIGLGFEGFRVYEVGEGLRWSGG